MKKLLITTLVLFFVLNSYSQLKQDVRGTIKDQESKMPLAGALIKIVSTDLKLGALSDDEGYFRIENVPVGRHDFQITYLGYETQYRRQVVVRSGKEMVLEIELLESVFTSKETVVKAKKRKKKANNEMATVSARTFSLEESKNYAAAAFDPARMAQNYAGVTTGGDDLFNEIVVRGNSPKGILWRMEGIEIPNPNHFSGGAGQGGAISMLSSTMLSNSDFFTGAFPSEYGNAMSGVFDLKLRKGNNEKRENSFMIGALGIEASAEGPFKKGYQGSYLINYRYSTLDFLSKVGLNPVGDIVPQYQDLSYNIFLPTQKYGNFSLFGLGGKNRSSLYTDLNTLDTSLDSRKFYDGFSEDGYMGFTGLKHLYQIDNSSYLKTVLITSYNAFFVEDNSLNVVGNSLVPYVDFKSNTINVDHRISMMHHKKWTKRLTSRSGIIYGNLNYDYEIESYNDDDQKLERIYNSNNNTSEIQAYSQIKYRLNSAITMNGGLHFTYLDVNKATAVEPRLGVNYKLNNKSSFSFAFGQHSKPENIAIYFYEELDEEIPGNQPNMNLMLSRAKHFVLGYDHSFNKDLRIKAEAYYQKLDRIPGPNNPNTVMSLTNTSSYWDILYNEFTSSDSFINKGQATNIGLDLTLEKFFSNNYYYLVTATLFNSQYSPGNGKTYNSRYNGNYQLNLLGGKEFILKKNRSLTLNGKLNFYGGNRYTPVDIEESAEKGYTVLKLDEPFAAQVDDYFRFDIGINYKIDKAKSTHTIMFDVQNVSNRQNKGGAYYSSETEQIEFWTMTGFFPFFNYRIEF